MSIGAISMPSYDAAGDGSGGGGTVLSDGQVSSGGSGTPAPGFGTSGGDAGGNAIDISDDTLIRIKGQKDPVKYSDYIKGFVPKSDFTRAQQAKAEEVRRANATLQERERQLSEFQSRQAGNAQPQQNPIGDLVKTLEGKPYISGADAAGLVKQVWEGGITKLAGAITQRDEVIKLLYNKLTNLDKSVGGFKTQNQESAIKGLLSRVKSELSLPDDPEVDEFLQDVYYSHEGEDLDSEFANIVKQRWDALQRLNRAADQKRVQAARGSVLNPVAGGKQGGNATPSRSLANKAARMDAKQLADEMWPLLGGGNT